MSQDYLAALLAVSRNKRYAKARLELLDAIGIDAVRGVINDCLSNGMPDKVLQEVAALMLDARAASPSDETAISRDQSNEARGNSEQQKAHTRSGLARAEIATPLEHPMSQDSFTARSSQQQGAEKETQDGRSNKASRKRKWSVGSGDELGIDRVSLNLPQGSTRATHGASPGRGGDEGQYQKAENARAGVEADTTPESRALVPPLHRHGQLDKQTGRKWCGYCNRHCNNKNFARHLKTMHPTIGSK